MKKGLIFCAAGLIVILVLAALGAAGLAYGWFGQHLGAGEVTNIRRPALLHGAQGVRAVSVSQNQDQILFGDLHVHTTFSGDAYLGSLPHQQGEGAHPPADACDFARFCSGLDFFALTDHAEGLTPRHWKESVDSIRQCDAVAASSDNPDLVAFVGWEWTQMGENPQSHYGHKNVVLRDIDPAHVPTPPIAAGGVQGNIGDFLPSAKQRLMMNLIARDSAYLDLSRYVQEILDVPRCASNIDVKNLPDDCREHAATPAELFEKLNQWELESMVIPHGTTWGYYSPAGADWRMQLDPGQHDPQRQTLVEIYSGHGNSEEYRSWRDVTFDAQGAARCPEPSRNYLPSCWRAGEIIEERCRKAGLDNAECARRGDEARQNYVDAGLAGHTTVPGVKEEDWLNAGQCLDCFLPAFNYRPRSSVQYMLALRRFDGPEKGRDFTFGFISSSDTHTARAGAGYKEFNRVGNTETHRKAVGPLARPMLHEPAVAQSRRLDIHTEAGKLMNHRWERERSSSYFYTGGLVAVHAGGRSRGNIWDGLKKREVYGTSGPKILLWFNAVDAADPAVKTPMGSVMQSGAVPRFEVKALGAFKQKPGCAPYAWQSLGKERLQRLCGGECDNPSDERQRITRIEVVRIFRQSRAQEDPQTLITDPWKSFECPANEEGCTISFEDPAFPDKRRDALYYVRVIQEPTAAVNGNPIKCEYNAAGVCIAVKPCGENTAAEDDCLAPAEERAWSSPIYVSYRSAPMRK